MASNYPELKKNMTPQIQYTLSRVGTKISTTGNIIVNLCNIIDQGNEISKLAREKVIEGMTGQQQTSHWLQWKSGGSGIIF